MGISKEYIVVNEVDEIVMRGSVIQIAKAFDVTENTVRNISKHGKIVRKGTFKGFVIKETNNSITTISNRKKKSSNIISFDSEVLPGKAYIVSLNQKRIFIKNGINSIPFIKVKDLANELLDIYELYGDTKE